MHTSARACAKCHNNYSVCMHDDESLMLAALLFNTRASFFISLKWQVFVVFMQSCWLSHQSKWANKNCARIVSLWCGSLLLLMLLLPFLSLRLSWCIFHMCVKLVFAFPLSTLSIRLFACNNSSLFSSFFSFFRSLSITSFLLKFHRILFCVLVPLQQTFLQNIGY